MTSCDDRSAPLMCSAEQKALKFPPPPFAFLIAVHYALVGENDFAAKPSLKTFENSRYSFNVPLLQHITARKSVHNILIDRSTKRGREFFVSLK